MRQPVDHDTQAPIDHAAYTAAMAASPRRPVVFAELWRAGADTGRVLPLTGLSLVWDRTQLHQSSGSASWSGFVDRVADPAIVPGAPGSLIVQGSTELRVFAGLRVGSARWVCPLGFFGVESYRVSGRLDVTVELADRSVRVSRARLEEPLQLAGGFQFLSDAFGQLLGARYPIEFLGDAAAVAPLRLLETRTDPWEALTAICTERALWARFGADGVCRVISEPVLGAIPPTFDFNAANSLVTCELSGSLDRFANRTYAASNKPDITAPLTAVSTMLDADSPFRYGGEAGAIPQWIEVPAGTVGEVQDAADTVQRAERPPEQVVITAPLDARLELVDAAHVVDPVKWLDRVTFMDQISFDFGAGLMTATSRADDQVETL